MFSRNSPIFIALVFTSDVVTGSCAWLGAYWLRFHSGAFSPMPAPDLEVYSRALPAVLVLLWLIYRGSRLYTPKRTVSIRTEVWDVVRANALLLAAIAALTLFVARTDYSRLALGLFAGLNTLGGCIARASARMVMHGLRRRGRNARRALIVGDGETARDLARRLLRNDWTGIHPVGFLGEEAMDEGLPPLLGTIDQLDATIASHEIDQVYLALPRASAARLEQLADQLDRHPVDLRLAPDLPLALSLNIRIDDLDGMPLISLRESPLEGWGTAAKWCMDKTVSLLVLAICALPMLLIAVLIKLTSKGPVFFRQERFGLNGRPFTMLKFRTMADRPADEDVEWGRRDEGDTAFGTFLRRTSLDELPQFINVLKGDMSVVGPRPEQSEVIPELIERVPQYMQRLQVKVGITGWAQVNGYRGDRTSLEERIQYDLYYIRNWSAWFDVVIVLRTFGAVVGHALGRQQ